MKEDNVSCIDCNSYGTLSMSLHGGGSECGFAHGSGYGYGYGYGCGGGWSSKCGFDTRGEYGDGSGNEYGCGQGCGDGAGDCLEDGSGYGCGIVLNMNVDLDMGMVK